MPFSSMARKKRAKALVSDFAAESQEVTGSGVKNQVNIEPTRLWVRDNSASSAAAATPVTNSSLSLSSLA